MMYKTVLIFFSSFGYLSRIPFTNFLLKKKREREEREKKQTTNVESSLGASARSEKVYLTQHSSGVSWSLVLRSEQERRR